ncbi:helix-turn-helix domain-containing protein [Chloroflexota bacterium]
MTKKYRNYSRKKSEHFGAILRKWRTRPGFKLTQAEAAQQLGLRGKCPAAYLSQIETGKKPIPEVVLLNIPRVYHRTEEEVLRAAFHPQLHFPFLSAVMEKNITWDEIEDIMKKLKKELEEDEKKEILNYANFLVLRRMAAKQSQLQ